MPTGTRTRPPTAADVAAAITALSAATGAAGSGHAKDDSLSKSVVNGAVGIVGLILVALIFWIGSSINDLSKSVMIMSANVDSLQKSIGQLQQGQGETSKTTTDLQAGLAAGGARTTAIEADINRVKERVRQLEGQRPLNVTP